MQKLTTRNAHKCWLATAGLCWSSDLYRPDPVWPACNRYANKRYSQKFACSGITKSVGRPSRSSLSGWMHATLRSATSTRKLAFPFFRDSRHISNRQRWFIQALLEAIQMASGAVYKITSNGFSIRMAHEGLEGAGMKWIWARDSGVTSWYCSVVWRGKLLKKVSHVVQLRFI